ncbi:hypothetical protein SHLO109777_12370 [Shewanella loihica]
MTYLFELAALLLLPVLSFALCAALVCTLKWHKVL